MDQAKKTKSEICLTSHGDVLKWFR